MSNYNELEYEYRESSTDHHSFPLRIYIRFAKEIYFLHKMLFYFFRDTIHIHLNLF